MEFEMPDIAGLIGLLKCMAAINQLKAGDTLAVTIRDADILAVLEKILDNDEGCRLMMQTRPEGHYMQVTKT